MYTRSITRCVILLQLFFIDHIFATNLNNSSRVSDDDGASVNKSSTPEHCTITVGPRQVNIAVHVFTLLASLVGNSLIITAFVRMKEPIMLLIANMAASDLLVAIFLIPRFITREVTGSNAFLVRGNGGMFLCKICTFFSDISLSVSTQSLVLIAVERFLAVVCPVLYKKITQKIRRFLVVSTWIMAMAIHSPYFYTFRLKTIVDTEDTNREYEVCQPSWEPAFDNKSAHLRYNIFLFVTVLFIPLLVICVLYTVIVVKLQRDKLATYRTDKGTRRIKERNKNLKRMAVATVAALVICWALYIPINFLKIFSPEKVPKCSKSFKVVDYISRVLASSYCAVNPWICFIFVRNFTRELSIICKRKRQRSDARRKSRKSNSCRTEIQRSLSESLQTATSLLSNGKNLIILESL
ncbi:prokineticin receptor 2-like [Oculina patagonica]